MSEQAEERRWGYVERLQLEQEDGSSLNYDALGDFSNRISDIDGFRNAEGGYVLIAFDIDGEKATTVSVQPPGGWYPVGSNRSPHDLIERAHEYLRDVGASLDRIDGVLR